MPRWVMFMLLPLLVAASGAYYWLFQRSSSSPIIGRLAPAFELQTLEGSPASLASYRGRPVIVNFWATWCEPCKQEMPALQAESAAHPDLVVLGVDNVESAVKVKPYVDQLGVRFPILLDQDGSVMERYQVTGLPTTFFIDRSGVLRSLYRGALSEDTLRTSIAAIDGRASGNSEAVENTSIASPAPVQAAPSPPASETPVPKPTAIPTTPGPLDQRDEPSLPQPREEGAAAVAGGKLYVIAGFDAPGRDTASVFVYDGRAWQTGASLPAALDHPSAAAIGGEVYLAGGFSGGPAVTGAYRLNAGKWQAISPLKHARGGLALVALNGRLYALGGIGQTETASNQAEIAPAEVYDPANGGWAELPPLAAPRDHVAGFVFEGKACIGGGRSPDTPRVDCFDPAANAWQRLPDLPRPTSGAGGEMLNGEPIIAGGEGDRVVDQLARFRAGAWQIEQMRQPRHGIQLAVLNGRAYACGGGNAPGLNAVVACTSIG